ncbi:MULTISPECIES: DMT family transporter [Actinomadura]|uniref:hypothetical protein n=1 Tax=unclassified Actinomadura TaxID=2626254 RepID=UPI00339765A6
MSDNRSRRIRLVGGGIIVAELAVQQTGFAFTSTLPALAAALVVTLVGSFALASYVGKRHGLGIREFDAPMWKLVARLAFSNTLIGIAYIFAVQKLGLGPVAAIGALGVLSVGLTDVWHSISADQPSPVKAWGWRQLGLRGLALLGVLVLTEPWLGEIDLVGLAWAVAAAWCFWNYIKVVFGGLAALEAAQNETNGEDSALVKQGLAVANLLSVPSMALVVLPFGGWGELFSDFVPTIGWGAVAGLLILFVPALLQAAAAGKVSDRVTGVLYCLDTPLAALVGMVGVLLGLLDETQWLGPWGWVGIGLVVIAALFNTLVSPEPPSIEEYSTQN